MRFLNALKRSALGVLGAKNGPSGRNDNARANRSLLHQKCSPATAEGWPRACAQLRPCRIQDQKPGVNGFRCWTTWIGSHSNMKPCGFEWSGLPHYRIPNEGYENPPNVTGRITQADMRITM